MPLYYHGSFLAVIGITGELDQIRQYVHLADRITHLLIREKELNRLSRSLEDKKHFVIDALIRNEIADPDYLDTCLSDLQVWCGIFNYGKLHFPNWKLSVLKHQILLHILLESCLLQSEFFLSSLQLSFQLTFPLYNNALSQVCHNRVFYTRYYRFTCM